MKPRLIALWALAVVLVFGTSRQVSAADLSDLTYTISNNEVTITDCNESAAGHLEIPATIQGKPVTSIGDWAFHRCAALTSVTIPEGITSIGFAAFGDCDIMTSINVDPQNPNFSGLDGVLFNKDQTELLRFPVGKTGAYSIPNGVTSMESGAFHRCAALTSVTIPEGVTSIPSEAFDHCIGLTSVNIPNSVTSIEGEAFWDCASLTSITIPNSVTNIGTISSPGLGGAFGYCISLTSVNIPASVTSIGDGTFRYCDSLTSVSFSGPPPAVGSAAFPTSNPGFTFKARAGFGASFQGHPVTQELQITHTGIDAGGNLMIDTDSLNTMGLKVLHTPTLGSSFSEFMGISKEGEGRVIIPSSAGLLNGSSVFFRVVYQ